MWCSAERRYRELQGPIQVQTEHDRNPTTKRKFIATDMPVMYVLWLGHCRRGMNSKDEAVFILGTREEYRLSPFAFLNPEK
jgi:hypothetical protein